MKKSLIYLNGGDSCLHSEERTKSEINEIKKTAKESGHIGYLSGYRFWNYERETVIVFFKEKPTQSEIDKRRSNGFLAAQWYYIRTKTK